MNRGNYLQAARDFVQARRAADLQRILSSVTGRSADLLPYEEVRKRLHATKMTPRGLQDIPLDAIIGSEGRYLDFTRTFLPKQDSDQERWARVFMATNDMSGLPPVEVYQVGEAYFVKDGNHRVSVARQMDATHIQAYVTELESPVSITPDMDMEALILKAEYADFLKQTGIAELRPEANLEVTAPGQYEKLAEHIAVHRYFMGLDQQHDITHEEAVTDWYDTVYLPLVQIIRRRGLLRDFYNRTETDLYLWVMEHRSELEEALGWQVDPDEAVPDLASRFSQRAGHVVARVGKKLIGTVTPDSLESGPPPGQWREERESIEERQALFYNLLVPISGEADSWHAVEQAIIFAQREGGRLRGLHVVPDAEAQQSEVTLAIRARFQQSCREAGVPGELAVTVGNVARQICVRSRWADLVIANLAHPPGAEPLSRLRSGFRAMIHRCPRPILAVPRQTQPIRKALLAYDGSAKAQEALFVAAYLTGHWNIPLIVLTVMQDEGMSETLTDARAYLKSHSVEAKFRDTNEVVHTAILVTAEKEECDLIIMGGYGFKPVLEVVVGSTVDHVLRASRCPVLICR